MEIKVTGEEIEQLITEHVSSMGIHTCGMDVSIDYKRTRKPVGLTAIVSITDRKEDATAEIIEAASNVVQAEFVQESIAAEEDIHLASVGVSMQEEINDYTGEIVDEDVVLPKKNLFGT
jgi:hypothetical protein